VQSGRWCRKTIVSACVPRRCAPHCVGEVAGLFARSLACLRTCSNACLAETDSEHATQAGASNAWVSCPEKEGRTESASTSNASHALQCEAFRSNKVVGKPGFLLLCCSVWSGTCTFIPCWVCDAVRALTCTCLGRTSTLPLERQSEPRSPATPMQQTTRCVSPREVVCGSMV